MSQASAGVSEARVTELIALLTARLALVLRPLCRPLLTTSRVL